MMQIVHVGEEELQKCPAAVVTTGGADPVFMINDSVWPHYSRYEQRFILAHEAGHYLLDTADETAADAFALGVLAGSERCSLKQSLMVLYDMQTIPYWRMKALYDLCIKVDKKNRKL